MFAVSENCDLTPKGAEYETSQQNCTYFISFYYQPHSWTWLKDTRFDVSNLRKASVTSAATSKPLEQEQLAHLSDIIDLDGEHLAGVRYGGMAPHR